MITITGGKLTTFRIMAEQALQTASPSLPRHPDFSLRKRYFDPLPPPMKEFNLDENTKRYLLGRYGVEAGTLLQEAADGENQAIGDLRGLWSELRYNASHGGVIHLDDLLLRRVRLGILLPDGARSEMPRIRQIVQAELGWDDQRWNAEQTRYRQIYSAYYSPNPTGKVDHSTGEIQWQIQDAFRPGMKPAPRKEPIAPF